MRDVGNVRPMGMIPADVLILSNQRTKTVQMVCDTALSPFCCGIHYVIALKRKSLKTQQRHFHYQPPNNTNQPLCLPTNEFPNHEVFNSPAFPSQKEVVHKIFHLLYCAAGDNKSNNKRNPSNL